MQESRWLAAERYEVGEVVGRGGYGMVCRGLDLHTGNPVALKMLSPEAGRDADVVERMLREQQALVALSGTCAVTAIDLCRLESGAPCLVMEWLDGCDLEKQLSLWKGSGHKPSAAQLLTVIKPLTETLQRAHELGIVHRDIKPANIFLTKDDDPGVRLLDFGLSRMKSAAPLTALGMVMGSPSYIAPETWRGNSAALDGRADLFALAVIVFRWLSGRLPFEAPDLIGKMTAVTSGPRPSLVTFREDLPKAVDTWVSRALAVEAADRYQTAGEFYEALAAALRGESLPPSRDVAGVRPPPSLETQERKGALAIAWQAAASLLKRFTVQPKRSSPPIAPSVPVVVKSPVTVVTAPAPALAAGDRATVWLDSTELEEAPDSFVPEAQPVLAPEAPVAALAEEPKPEEPQPPRRAKLQAKKKTKKAGQIKREKKRVKKRKR
ncbi:MAG: serine/threonine protein kinase [Myxococcales bacterium]|nr:MAG: serine/threonine protein kinase [Myxococcales bacterium]